MRASVCRVGSRPERRRGSINRNENGAPEKKRQTPVETIEGAATIVGAAQIVECRVIRIQQGIGVGHLKVDRARDRTGHTRVNGAFRLRRRRTKEAGAVSAFRKRAIEEVPVGAGIEESAGGDAVEGSVEVAKI